MLFSMNNSLLILIIACSFFLLVIAHNENGSRLFFIPDNNSLCIDGTPAAYYLNKGYGSGANSWLIYFEGGGWCYDINLCAIRATNGAGSSTKYLEYVDFSRNENYFSQIVNNNIFYKCGLTWLHYFFSFSISIHLDADIGDFPEDSCDKNEMDIPSLSANREDSPRSSDDK
mgnify:CR=1 FL=1